MKPSRNLHVQASFRGALLVILLAVLIFTTVQPVLAAGCPNGKCFVFLPSVKSKAQQSGDLAIHSIEVTQAVQDPNNSVPLVAGRNTMLRIYARTLGSTRPMSNVKISVTASNGSYMLNQSPVAYSATVPLNFDRANLQSSINITLPPSWLSGTVSLTVRLDPDNMVGEPSESNNVITKQYNFQPVPPLRVKIVPIKYINEKDGITYAAPTTDTIKDWILRTYPVPNVEISWHAPYIFKGDLSKQTDFNRLLNEVTTLKGSEKAPNAQVYYALVPTRNGGHSWFYSGIAGIGWIGSRTAVGLDLPGSSGQIAAHEIGHNLGQEHAPCGVAAGPNTKFPYSDGSIGQLGIDTFGGMLYSPATKDVMGYCSPKWISDFTYRALFKAQSAQAAQYGQSASIPADAAMAQRGLLVRAVIDASGVELKPAYVVPGALDSMPEAGNYMMETLDAQGEVLSQTAVRAYEALTGEGEVDGVAITAINAMIPLPDQPVAAFRLVKDGQVIASQTLAADVQQPLMAGQNAQSAGYLSTGSQSELEAALAQLEQPALVRYSTDGGATWTTLGMDITADTMLDFPGEAAIYQVLNSGIWQ